MLVSDEGELFDSRLEKPGTNTIVFIFALRQVFIAQAGLEFVLLLPPSYAPVLQKCITTPIWPTPPQTTDGVHIPSRD